MAGTEVVDYRGALRYITSTGRFGIKMGLERTRALLDAVGSPDAGLRGVLVGGTNGKGSTCAYLCAIFKAAGLAVASMPKPHLVSYTERVVVDGIPISEPDFTAAVAAMVPAVDAVTPEHGAPTEFEILTALALRHARDRDVDLLVCEVGMGGRLDATNITDLGVKVITSVDLDHQQYLGDTVPEIASEKAGIIRGGDAVVVGPLPADALAVVVARCAEVGAELTRYGRDFTAGAVSTSWTGTTLDYQAGSGPGSIAGLRTAMLGEHQARNAAIAVAAARVAAGRHRLDVDDPAIRAGVAEARWPGRMEVFAGAPRMVVDGGHNPAAVAAVVAAVGALGTPSPPVLLFGAMADKDYTGMLRLLPAAWRAVFTEVPEDRALPAAELLRTASTLGRAGDLADAGIGGALAASRDAAGPGGTVVVLGSLYLAGEIRRRLTGDSA